MNKKLIKIFILLAAVNFTHILDFMIIMPLGNYLMPYFNISTQKFSVLVASYALSAGCSSFLSAFFVNQFDRKKVLVFAYAGFLIGTLACGLAPSYEFLLSARIFTGIFGGMIGAQLIAIASDLVPFEHRGKAIGIIMSAFALASSLGVTFSLYLSFLFNWHAPFLFVVGLGVIILPLLYKFVPSMAAYKQAKINRIEVIKQVFSEKKQYLALLFSCSMFLGHFIVIPFINPYLEFNKGFTKAETPLVYLFGGLSALFASYIIGKLADQYGKLKTFMICTLLSLPLVLLVTQLPDMPLYLMLLIFSVWFMFSTGRSVTSQSLVSNVAKPEFRGSFQSFNGFVQQIGSGMASLLAGFIVIENANGSIEKYHFLGYISLLILTFSIGFGYYIFKGDDAKKSI